MSALVSVNFIILLSSLRVYGVRISDQKCAEYQQLCSQNPSPFVFYGKEATPKEFPYMALIGFNSDRPSAKNGIEWLCDGTLISDNFVLTVAHCVKIALSTYVLLGNLNRDSDVYDANSIRLRILKRFVHPNFDRQTKRNDIGLLRLASAVLFSEYIRPACLTQLENHLSNIGSRTFVTGWGSIKSLESIQTHLQKVEMNLVPYEQCESYYKRRDGRPRIYKESQFCIKSVFNGGDLCLGFSGSPLINGTKTHSCLLEIIGICSFGAPICRIGTLTVFTHVSGYLDWIEDIVWLGGDGSVAFPTTTAEPFESPLNNRIFSKKCREYHDELYKTISNLNGSGLNPIPGRVLDCPFASTPYIVDGLKAEGKEFPHMALIGYVDASKNGKIAWNCGGSLISEQFVMTAAHCLDIDRLGPAIFVLLGELDFSVENDDARPERYKIAQRIKHPQYTPKLKYNDIALIRLETKVIFNKYIRPACLPEFSLISFQATATGWGQTAYNQPQSPHLLKTELNLFTHLDCNSLYKALNSTRIDKGIDNDTQICAGVRFHQEDTCQGDSGGPLQIFHYKYLCMYEIVGIASFGPSRCGTGVPGVYTRVYSYLDWIESIVWPNPMSGTVVFPK